MRKMKNYLKIGILLLGLILIMTNCESENEVMENPITIEKEFIIKQYHFKDLSSNFKFQKAIEKLNSKKSKSIYSNKSTDDIYNFTIDSTRIKEVIKGNYTSYTLLINRPFNTSEYFENLVIEIKENETINAFIIKYILSSPIKIFEEHNSFSFQANFTIVPLDINNINLSSKSTSNSCSQIAQTWCNWSYPHIAGPSCYEANDNRLFTVLIDDPDCPENGYPSYGGGGGGGSTTGSNPDPILTSPINPDGTPVKFPVIPSANLINNLEGLNEAQIAWINDDVNEESVRIIDSFLKDNFYSPKTENFAKLAIEAKLNGGEVDFVDRIILDKTFLDNPKAMCVYEKLKEAGGIKSILKDFFDTQSTANLIIKLEPNLTCNSPNPFGCTSFDKNTETGTIKIDTDFITQFQWNNSGGIYQTPLLNIAKVIIHEAIHAQFFYNRYQVNNNFPVSNLTFEELYEEYRNLEGWQHKLMAGHYLKIISDALMDVHPLLNDQTYIDNINSNYPDWTWEQIYNNLAWSGLTNTPAGITYLSNTDNANLYSLQNTDVAVNSNETPNCTQ